MGGRKDYIVMLIVIAVICMGIGTYCLMEAKRADDFCKQYTQWGYDMIFETALEVNELGKEVDELKYKITP